MRLFQYKTLKIRIYHKICTPPTYSTSTNLNPLGWAKFSLLGNNYIKRINPRNTKRIGYKFNFQKLQIMMFQMMIFLQVNLSSTRKTKSWTCAQSHWGPSTSNLTSNNNAMSTNWIYQYKLTNIYFAHLITNLKMRGANMSICPHSYNQISLLERACWKKIANNISSNSN